MQSDIQGKANFLAETFTNVSKDLVQLILSESKGDIDEATFRLLV